jgi:hypothetical protein
VNFCLLYYCCHPVFFSRYYALPRQRAREYDVTIQDTEQDYLSNHLAVWQKANERTDGRITWGLNQLVKAVFGLVIVIKTGTADES